MNLYKVENGEVFEIDDVETDSEYHCDWCNNCRVLASNAERAIKAANHYDNGLIAPDNHIWRGIKVIAILDN